MALKIVKKATSQREDLALYFGFCKEFGVSNAHDILIFVRVSEKDIEAIEKVINEWSQKKRGDKGGA